MATLDTNSPPEPMVPSESVLRVTEIYASIQGESQFAGVPCVFIRLTGCPLRCKWCDTAYGFEGGQSMSIPSILSQVAQLGIDCVELTGGEPLAQLGSYELLNQLNERFTHVLLETSGSQCIKDVHRNTHIIMDLKCPDSGMSAHNNWDNLSYLKPTDEIKFVIASLQDYQWACQTMSTHQLHQKHNILFSPAFGLMNPKDLAEWIVRDKLKVRLNMQLHKIIWHPRKRGV